MADRDHASEGLDHVLAVEILVVAAQRLQGLVGELGWVFGVRAEADEQERRFRTLDRHRPPALVRRALGRLDRPVRRVTEADAVALEGMDHGTSCRAGRGGFAASPA